MTDTPQPDTLATLTADLARAIAAEAQQKNVVAQCEANAKHQREKLAGFKATRRAIEAKIRDMRRRPKKAELPWSDKS